MRLACAAVAALLACSPSAARPPGPVADDPAVVRVASWNVHDLFDEVDRVDPPGELDAVPTLAEVEAKVSALAAVIRRIDADAVLLQEVEDAPLLRRLAERSGYPEARLLEGNDPRGIDVALLSRLPVLAYRGHAAARGGDGLPLWPRDAVVAELGAGARRLALVGTHLSSRLSDPGGVRRRAQAAALRALADEAVDGPAALVVAGGDLNDEAKDPALAPLLEDGAWVDAVRGGPSAPEAWTWGEGSERAALDHLLLPAAAADAVLDARVEWGADVAAASDHRPVVVDLLVR
jgi:endonuclease/exonuclease/phosphatase family metal-dependent hydrolase